MINKHQSEQVIESVYKSIIGFLPSSHIFNEILEFRSKVKQARLNKFSEFLKDGFEGITGESFDPENLKSEYFIDAFETIIRKVLNTSNEEKLKRYRNVLLRTIFEKNDSEIFFKYVGLIENVSETQMLILSGLNEHQTFTDTTIEFYLSDPQQYASDSGWLHKPEYNCAGFKLYNGQIISFTELSLFIHDLKSTGIINVDSNPASKSILNSDFISERYTLSSIGKGFVDFVSDYGK